MLNPFAIREAKTGLTILDIFHLQKASSRKHLKEKYFENFELFSIV